MSTATVMSQTFFVSHNSADTEKALELARHLERMGHTTILDALDFHAGENFLYKMMMGLEEAEYVICVLTQNFLDSEFCMLELLTALKRSPLGNPPKLFLVKYDDCVLPDMLSMTIYIDVRDKNDEEIFEVLERELIATISGERRFSLFAEEEEPPEDWLSQNVRVIFTKFRQLEGTKRNPGELWPYRLRNDLKEFIREQQVGFLELPQIIHSDEEAQELLHRFNAHIVIWGVIAESMVEVNYAINFQNVFVTNRRSFVPLSSSTETFQTFIDKGADADYVFYTVAAYIQFFSLNREETIELVTSALEVVPAEIKLKSSLSVELLYQLRCIARYLIGLEEEAWADLRQINDLNEGKVTLNLLLLRGQLLLVNHPDKAIQDFTWVIESNPTLIGGFMLRAIAYMIDGHWDEAILDLDKCYNLLSDPSYQYVRDLVSAYIFGEKSNCLFLRGDIPDALVECNKALDFISKGLKLFPLLREAEQRLLEIKGRILIDLDQLYDAVDCFSQAIDINKEDAESYTGRGRAYLRLNNEELALSDFNTALELDSMQTTARRIRAAMSFQQGNLEQVFSDCNFLLDEDENDATALRLRGFVYLKRGDKSGAYFDLLRYKNIVKDPRQEVIEMLEPLEKEAAENPGAFRLTFKPWKKRKK